MFPTLAKRENCCRVKADAMAVARFPCYPSSSTASEYKYEVHFVSQVPLLVMCSC